MIEDIYNKTDLEKEIWSLLEGTVELLGFHIVDVEYVRSHGGMTLRITIEKEDAPVTIDDCVEVSRTCSDILDIKDPISGAYNLEVSSPGINRPLKRIKDFERFKGEKAKIETGDKIEGRHRFKGTLQGVREGNILIEAGDEVFSIPFTTIKKARLDRI
ncbi:MAG TPA: ribosome maturation factor RimP [Dissulfuribacter thermophilus]|uniref:Ribosome maturation factor RimP n=1 Tax=Dissulfuribacter thermophilus TaxID=1156395 RepID=A0A7V2SVX1_9BACT|nr:ribosome maturation factor RimP [Dissulfuribacter thermophilus]